MYSYVLLSNQIATMQTTYHSLSKRTSMSWQGSHLFRKQDHYIYLEHKLL